MGRAERRRIEKGMVKCIECGKLLKKYKYGKLQLIDDMCPSCFRESQLQKNRIVTVRRAPSLEDME